MYIASAFISDGNITIVLYLMVVSSCSRGPPLEVTRLNSPDHHERAVDM